MKKFTAICLAVLLLISATPLTGINFLIKSSALSTLAETGQCGDNVTYSFDNGVLTISGTGDMYDYNDGSSPFRNNSAINRIIIENGITNISASVFFYCEYLTSVIISDTVTSIGDNAFCCCTRLTNITIPNSVTSIGEEAFSGSGLERIAIPASVINIGFFSFLDCSENLTSITVDRDNPVYDSRNNCNAIIDKRSNCLLQGCRNTVIPDSVRYIAPCAFECCKGLTSINIPDGVESIGNCAFFNCSSLETVFISSSIKTIDSSAFSRCTKLTDVYFDGTEQQWNAIEYYEDGNEDLSNANIHFHEHSYTCSVIRSATCTKDGVMRYTCSCGETYTEVIPAGHTMGGWSVEVEPTTTERGLLVRKCKKCNYHEEMDMGFADFDVVKSISLSSNEESITPGSFVTVTAIINPKTAKNKNVIWSSSDESVATVYNGVINGIGAGSAVIIAETEDGGYKDFCLVKVIGITASSKTTVIDTASSMIYGLAPNLSSLDGYVEVAKDDTALEYDSDVLGTGSIVNVVRDGKAVDSYEIIIFGDVNGDGWYDGTDATIVSCLANGMLTKDNVSKAVYMAADCNHDGVIDSTDVLLLQKAGVLRTQIDQSKSEEELLETSSAYVEYLNLIDQTIEPEKEEITDNETEKTVFGINFVIEFIQKLISKIETFIASIAQLF